MEVLSSVVSTVVSGVSKSVLVQQGSDLNVPDSTLDLTGYGFDSTEIDRRLIYLATLGLTGELIILDGNDPYTSVSLAARTTLLTAGNLITGGI